MKIYGVAMLALCFLLGQIVGDFIGLLFGFNGNIGGVAFGMLLLIILGDWMNKKKLVEIETRAGIQFWSGMYIPIVVAMSSIQNVKAALSGGWVAIVVGIVATYCCFLLVPVLSRLSLNKHNEIK
jgi:malonate transporter MadL subunit